MATTELDERARYMKKKVKGGPIEIDPHENAIVVNYEVEATILGDYGEPMMVERKQNQKKVKIKSLTENANIPRLAEEVVQNCRLIHVSKLPLVEDLLYALQERQLRNDYTVKNDKQEVQEMRRSRNAERNAQLEKETAAKKKEELANSAKMDDLDTYIEMCYEEKMEDKVKATYLVLQLARNPDNLEALVQNETLLGVLSRLVKEDSKKSLDLTINIVYIFYSFSNFSQFHPTILQYQMGDMIMKIIDLEIRRHLIRSQEKESVLKDKAGSNQNSSGNEEDPYAGTEVNKRPEKEGKSGVDRERKLKLLQKKQEKLLYVCFHVLLNLAEDISIEKKMKKRKIVSYLCMMLERKNVELLILVVRFLKKLSIFKENVSEMGEHGAAEKLTKILDNHSQEILVAMTLRLLFNLSFHAELRDGMVKNGLIPKLIELLRKPTYRSVILRLLYHLSIEDKNKSTFGFADAIPIITQLVSSYPEQQVQKELIALAINLTGNACNAEMMCEKQGFIMLMKRVLSTRDPLLMKVIRNISMHDKVKKLFAEWGQDLCMMLEDTDNPDFLVEILGTLGNLNIPDMMWPELMKEHRLLDFLQKHLHPGFSEDDIALEVVILVGTLACEPACAQEIASTRVIGSLYDLLNEKQEDDEFVLQLLYAFTRFCLHEETRGIVLEETQVVFYFIDLLVDKNPEIRKNADAILDIVMDYSEEWAAKIRERKFALHNMDWLKVVEEDEAEDEYDNDVLGKMQEEMAHGSDSDSDGGRNDLFHNVNWNVDDLEMPDEVPGDESDEDEDEDDEDDRIISKGMASGAYGGPPEAMNNALYYDRAGMQSNDDDEGLGSDDDDYGSDGGGMYGDY